MKAIATALWDLAIAALAVVVLVTLVRGVLGDCEHRHRDAPSAYEIEHGPPDSICKRWGSYGSPSHYECRFPRREGK